MTRFVALLVALVVSMPIVTAAGPVAKYSKQALEQAQDAGKPVIVFVTASWCPNCRGPATDRGHADQGPGLQRSRPVRCRLRFRQAGAPRPQRDDAVHPDRLQGQDRAEALDGRHRPRADPHPVPERALIRWAWAPAPSGSPPAS